MVEGARGRRAQVRKVPKLRRETTLPVGIGDAGVGNMVPQNQADVGSQLRPQHLSDLVQGVGGIEGGRKGMEELTGNGFGISGAHGG